MVYRPLCPKIARTPMLAQTLQILEFATNENHKREISVEGRSSCINMKKEKRRNERRQKFWLFLSAQCSRDIENRGKVRVHCTKGYGRGNE